MENPSLHLDSPTLFWNAVALECNRVDHTGAPAARNQRGPTASSRALAIVHIGMHDAYVAQRNGLGMPVAGHDPYLPPSQLPAYVGGPGANALKSPAAALAASAAATLLHLYPSQAPYVNEQFNIFCARWGGDDAAHRFGRAVAAAVISLRRSDGGDPDPDQAIPDYIESPAAGRHREDPLNRGQSFLGPRYGFVRPFGIKSFVAMAPPWPLGSKEYNDDLAEVVAKGSAPGTPGLTRSADESVQGLFWAYDGPERIGTPPRLYNQVIREVVLTRNLAEEQRLRLFFMANLAMGDAGILAWFYKYHFDLWRPVIGIREHHASMGPSAAGGGQVTPPCDPFWRPLGAPRTNSLGRVPATFTPPFPAYPSGHATFGAAALHVTRLYLHRLGLATLNPDGTDNVDFAFVSDELNGVSSDADGNVRPRHVRIFAGLHEAIFENSVSRVYLGVHWRFDGTTGHSAKEMLANVGDLVGGVPLGLAIAEQLAGGATPPKIQPSSGAVKPPTA